MEKIYGVPDPENYYTPEFEKEHPHRVSSSIVRYIYNRPKLAPIWEPFWQYYNFSTEEELDAFLNQYLFKLKNFTWENAFKAVQDYIKKYKSYVYLPGGTRVKLSEEEIQTALTLHQLEYEHYLGPIKYALKYDKGGKVRPIIIWPADVYQGRVKPATISSCGSTTRQSIIITLYDGTKFQVPSKGPAKKGASGDILWCLSLKEIFEITKLPNVVSIEASDTPYLGAEVYGAASAIWDKVKQQIYINYVKYMQSPPSPTTQPGTQPSGAPPSGAVVTSKAWTWIAIGGAAILLAILLTGRE
jgi:hypothetical protein